MSGTSAKGNRANSEGRKRKSSSSYWAAGRMGQSKTEWNTHTHSVPSYRPLPADWHKKQASTHCCSQWSRQWVQEALLGRLMIRLRMLPSSTAPETAAVRQPSVCLLWPVLLCSVVLWSAVTGPTGHCCALLCALNCVCMCAPAINNCLPCGFSIPARTSQPASQPPNRTNIHKHTHAQGKHTQTNQQSFTYGQLYSFLYVPEQKSG